MHRELLHLEVELTKRPFDDDIALALDLLLREERPEKDHASGGEASAYLVRPLRVKPHYLRPRNPKRESWGKDDPG